MCRSYWQGHCRDKHGISMPVKCGGDIFKCDRKKKEEPEMTKETNVIGTRDWYAKQIREVGEFLMKSADTLALDVKGRSGIDIWASINPNDLTEVKIESRFIPEANLIE